MPWVLIAILSYFFGAVVSFFDKYLLTASIPNPKIYSFYVGILGILSLFLIPFVDFMVPPLWQIVLAFAEGALFVCGLFWYGKGLRLFETSRLVPAIGGLTSILVFGLTYFFGRGNLMGEEILAFIFLVTGSALITLEKEKLITFQSFKIAAIVSFFLSLAFFLAKILFSVMPFWPAFIWMRIGGFLMALFFLFYGEVREELFVKRTSFKQKTAGIFFLGQTLGAGSAILQNFALALVPFALLPFVNALQGTQYLFLLIFAVFLSLKFPGIVKEEISGRIIFQKLFAILFIGLGLMLLVLK